jgi:hypothetical protein
VHLGSALFLVPGDELIGNVIKIIAHDLWLRANPQDIVTGPLDERCFPAGRHGTKRVPCMARDQTQPRGLNAMRASTADL